MIRTYEINKEQAKKIPSFCFPSYFPEFDGKDLPDGLELIDDSCGDLNPPKFKYSLGYGARCDIILRKETALIQTVYLSHEDEDEFNKAKQNLKKVFGFELDPYEI